MRPSPPALAACLCVWAGACGAEDGSPPPSSPSLALVSADAWVEGASLEGSLLVSTSTIRVGDGPELTALLYRRASDADLRDGEGGPRIPRLQEALAGGGDRLVVAFDRRTPYRTVADVARTALAAGRERVALIVRRGTARPGTVSALPVTTSLEPRAVAPEPSQEVFTLEDVLAGGAVAVDAEEIFAEMARDRRRRPPARGSDDEGSRAQTPSTHAERSPQSSRPRQRVERDEPDPLDLTLAITDHGVRVTGTGGTLAPGCRELAADEREITLRSRRGAARPTALAACLRRVKEQFPDEDRLTVEADPEIPFRTVAIVVAASRGSAEAPLFPAVVLRVIR